jgi:hypothetical protein
MCVRDWEPLLLEFVSCDKPFALPFCHCEEALAEADVAIQSGSLCALPYAFAGLPRRAVALLAMTGCGGKAKGGKTEIPGERERGFFSTFLSLRALLGVAIHAGSSCALPMVPLDCRVAHAPRNDKGVGCAGDAKGCVFGIGNGSGWSSFHVISLSLFLFVIASPFGRGNPVGGVVCAAHGSAGLPHRSPSSQ